MDKITGYGKSFIDRIEAIASEKVNNSSTFEVHQKLTFEGGLYGGVNSLTDVSTKEEEEYALIGVKLGIVAP